jgi:ADP-ribosylglycohydrolase
MQEVFNSYRLWLNTQFGSNIPKKEGWIAQIKDLYATRAPGNTCILAIRGNNPGSIEKPINNSAGCGGVMRVAPAGLMYHKTPKLAFQVGAECAALTHSHPRGYLPAGALSEMIAHIINGKNIDEAVTETIQTLKTYKDSEPVVELMSSAQKLAKSKINPEDAIKMLGEGWVGDEAIAISTYCALKEPKNFQKAVTMAVNHNGDSDSTGAILGNILGAHLGVEEIPAKWLQKVELSDELGQLAKDLYVNPQDIENAAIRYPIK